MNCTFEKEKLTGYFDNELDVDGKSEVERHIAACSECLRELGDIQSASQTIRALPRLRVPESVRAAVSRAIVAPPAFGRRRAFLQWTVAAAAALLVALSVVHFSSFEKRSETPSAKTPVEMAKTPPPETKPASRDEETRAKDREADKSLKTDSDAGGRKGGGKENFESQKQDAHREESEDAAPMKDEKAKAGDSNEPKPEESKKDEAASADKKAKEDPKKETRGRTQTDSKVTVYTCSASAMGEARERVLAALKSMGVKVEVGAGEYDRSHAAKDTCITLEITDAQLSELKKKLAGEKVLTFSEGYDARKDGESELALGEEKMRRLKETEKKPDAPKADQTKKEPTEGGGSGGTGAQPSKAEEKESKKEYADSSGKSSAPGANTPPKRKVIIYFKELVPAEKKK